MPSQRASVGDAARPLLNDGAKRRFLRELDALRGRTVAALTWVPSESARSRYAAVLQTRLLFLAALEARGFLDRGFLRELLAVSMESGQDRFYLQHLLPLCFRSLSAPTASTSETGRAPYVAPGLMVPLQLELGRAYEGSSPGALPDALFAAWLDVLEAWSPRLWPGTSVGGWPAADLLGVAFERGIDQKGAGAYYTAGDVTGYITRSTLLPRVLEAAQEAVEGLPGSAPTVVGLVARLGVGRYLLPSLRETARLPAETEAEQRERFRRRQRLEAEAAAGSVCSADHFVRHNLDLARLAVDWVGALPTAAHVRAVHQEVLTRVTVLDPTCGAGAFLAAAMDALAPLYETALARIRYLDGDDSGANAGLSPGTVGGLPRAAVAAQVLTHNLYGVDLMEEAVEAARLSLCLRALAREPALPGCGHGSGGPLLNAVFHLAVGDTVAQLGFSGGRHRARGSGELDWADAFPAAAVRGGFDVVLGNPPFVDSAAIGGELEARGFATARCGNLYAPVFEQALTLLRPCGRLGMIVPISAISVESYRPLLERALRRPCALGSFASRPAKLFSNVEHRLAVFLLGPEGAPRLLTAPYQHWYERERPHLFERLEYWESSLWPATGMPTKCGSELGERLLRRLVAIRGTLADLLHGEGGAVWLHDAPTYWVRALPFDPGVDGNSRSSTHYHRIPVDGPAAARMVAAILCSTTFYFYYKMVSNCRDLGRREWSAFPLGPLPAAVAAELAELGRELEARLKATATLHQRIYPSGAVRYHEYHPGQAKDLLDKIDAALAVHYGFSEDELCYLLDYELKYRLGRAEEPGANDAG